MRFLSLLVVAVMAIGCSILPNTGPSRAGIYQSSTANGGDTRIVNVTKNLAATYRAPTGYGLPSSFFSNTSTDYERIAPGDVLSVTIWENTDEGVFATLGNRVTQLAPMRVNEGGTIFVPYVGELKVSGRTSDQLRQQITQKLEDQTPFPQVEVRREPGQRGGAMIFTNTGGGRLVPFHEGNLTLASMLASVGGGAGDPASTRVTLRRGSQSGTILLQDLFDNPRNDVKLRDRDRITIEEDRRYFRMLGQGAGQGLVPFTRPELNLLDALSEAGGLNAQTADATGVFVFRSVPADEANRLLGRSDLFSTQQFAFVVNMLEADGLFIAQDFQIRDKDIIYVTEAPFVTWTRVIGAIAQGAASIESLSSVQQNLSNL